MSGKELKAGRKPVISASSSYRADHAKYQSYEKIARSDKLIPEKKKTSSKRDKRNEISDPTKAAVLTTPAPPFPGGCNDSHSGSIAQENSSLDQTVLPQDHPLHKTVPASEQTNPAGMKVDPDFRAASASPGQIKSANSTVIHPEPRKNRSIPSIKKLIRSYFYISLLPANYSELEFLHSEIQFRWMAEHNEVLYPEYFQQMIQASQTKWEIQIDQAENILERSDFVNSFLERMKRKNCPWKTDASRIRKLLADYLCMILQNTSVELKKSHVKPKDISLLLKLLENEPRLRSCRKIIEQPLRDAAWGKIQPESAEYLIGILVRARLMAAFYAALIQGFEGRMDLCIELLKQIPSLSLEEQEELIHPEPCESIINSSIKEEDPVLRPFVY